FFFVVFFFYLFGDLRDLHSFPTRRSSDLFRQNLLRTINNSPGECSLSLSFVGLHCPESPIQFQLISLKIILVFCCFLKLKFNFRSEEHTSELQSRENLVCRLLLEKKKKNI